MTLEIVGKKMTYLYDNGWEYHIYYENAYKVTYLVVSGRAAGRIAYQEAIYTEVAPRVYNVVWYEETGTVVSQVVNLVEHRIYGFVAFPKWVWDHTEKTRGRKEEKIQDLLVLREAGPDAPRHIVYMTGAITSVEHLGIGMANVF